MGFADFWSTIDSGPWVLGVVRAGYRLEVSSPPPVGEVLRGNPVPPEPERRTQSTYHRPPVPLQGLHRTPEVWNGVVSSHLPSVQTGRVGGVPRLRDAFLLPRAPYQYLVFTRGARALVFRPPLGLSTAPRVFTRVAGALVSFIHPPHRLGGHLEGSDAVRGVDDVGSSQHFNCLSHRLRLLYLCRVPSVPLEFPSRPPFPESLGGHLD